MKLEYFGDVDQAGILKLTNKTGLSNDLHYFKGKKVRMTIEEASKRSNAQNKYFHAVCVPIVRAHLIDLGWKEAKSSDWVKDYIKFHCLIKEYHNEDTGEVIKSLGKTSGLSVAEFIDFIADIQHWAASELGLIIPDPNEQTDLNFER